MSRIRYVRTEKSENGYLLYRLRESRGKYQSDLVFGYSTRHKHWVRIYGLEKSSLTIVMEDGETAKETIAAWAMR